MKSQGHEDIYRLAHDAAQAELAEITAEFERLRTRKEQVERLVVALKPIINEDEAPAPAATKEQFPEHPAEPVNMMQAVTEESTQPLGVGADPFQRRAEHVLGIGAGIRDVRQYTRQF